MIDILKGEKMDINNAKNFAKFVISSTIAGMNLICAYGMFVCGVNFLVEASKLPKK